MLSVGDIVGVERSIGATQVIQERPRCLRPRSCFRRGCGNVKDPAVVCSWLHSKVDPTTNHISRGTFIIGHGRMVGFWFERRRRCALSISLLLSNFLTCSGGVVSIQERRTHGSHCTRELRVVFERLRLVKRPCCVLDCRFVDEKIMIENSMPRLLFKCNLDRIV